MTRLAFHQVGFVLTGLLGAEDAQVVAAAFRAGGGLGDDFDGVHVGDRTTGFCRLQTGISA